MALRFHVARSGGRMRSRPAARLFVINSSGYVLLFKFTHDADALAGRSYWATPGGGVEHGESFEQAAIRELQEETGIVCDEIGASVAQRDFVMTLLVRKCTTRYVEKAAAKIESCSGLFTHNVIVRTNYLLCSIVASVP